MFRSWPKPLFFKYISTSVLNGRSFFRPPPHGLGCESPLSPESDYAEFNLPLLFTLFGSAWVLRAMACVAVLGREAGGVGQRQTRHRSKQESIEVNIISD